jgi:hypothetical protein
MPRGEPRIVHHAHATDATTLTRIINEGSITLDPPGIEITVTDV